MAVAQLLSHGLPHRWLHGLARACCGTNAVMAAATCLHSEAADVHEDLRL